MNRIMIKDFQNKIVNANQEDLLMITYDMLFASLEEAGIALKAQDDVGFNQNMLLSQKLLRELSDNLDFKYQISKDLMAIYIYVNKMFVEVKMQEDPSVLEKAIQILRVLYDGFDQIQETSDQVTNRPIIDNSQKVFAGLTYGKGTLNETVGNNGQSRGFQA